MDKETLMERLRNPQKFQKRQTTNAAQTGQAATAVSAQAAKRKSRMPMIVTAVVLGLIFISLLFIFSVQKRAENIPAFLDSSVLKGLMVDKVFTPGSGKRYVQVSEGADRNVSAQELGSTLPVISRYNFRALTKENYKVIGAAPWALLINVSANIEDPDLIRYLFNQDVMIESFLTRPDVAPILEDPAMLAKLAGDTEALQSFFVDDSVKKVLASPRMIEALAGSRFMAYLLISKSGKYYRDHPEEAAELINSNPVLRMLKKNETIRQSVTDSVYLKNIAPILLK